MTEARNNGDDMKELNSKMNSLQSFFENPKYQNNDPDTALVCINDFVIQFKKEVRDYRHGLHFITNCETLRRYVNHHNLHFQGFGSEELKALEQAVEAYSKMIKGKSHSKHKPTIALDVASPYN